MPGCCGFSKTIRSGLLENAERAFYKASLFKGESKGQER